MAIIALFSPSGQAYLLLSTSSYCIMLLFVYLSDIYSYYNVIPPSTINSAPVVKLALSPQK